MAGFITVEPQFNEPLYSEVPGITNDFLYPSNSKICGKEPRCNETSVQRTNFASPLALRFFEVPLYNPKSIKVQGFPRVFSEKSRTCDRGKRMLPS